MEMLKEIMLYLVQAFIVVAVPLLTGFLTKFLNAKAAQLKEATANEYIDNVIGTVENLVQNAVAAVSQTYVDNLKKDGMFNAKEQSIAFDMAFDKVVELVQEENKLVIDAVFGDFSAFVSTLIEAAVREQKI